MIRILIFQIFLMVSFILFIGCSSSETKIVEKVEHTKIVEKVEHTKIVEKQFQEKLEEKELQHYTMNSYKIFGIQYQPQFKEVGTVITGEASWYGPGFHKRLTSNGETYNMYDYTAAHKTLPMNTMVKVTNHKNNKSIIVRINDRGPFVGDRVIDLSKVAAMELEMVEKGLVPVKIEVLGFYPNNKNKVGLQIAAFKNVDKALEFQKTIKKIDGYDVIVKESKDKKYQLLLKGFLNEQEARNYKVFSEFKDSLVVQL